MDQPLDNTKNNTSDPAMEQHIRQIIHDEMEANHTRHLKEIGEVLKKTSRESKFSKGVSFFIRLISTLAGGVALVGFFTNPNNAHLISSSETLLLAAIAFMLAKASLIAQIANLVALGTAVINARYKLVKLLIQEKKSTRKKRPSRTSSKITTRKATPKKTG